MPDKKTDKKKELVTITVDGKEIKAPKGENLLKVILANKTAVPHYCYHPGLSIAGACRMCMVEIEKAPRPMIACNTTITDGMVVKTKTDKLKDIQKWNLAFHLINHPIDCPICDQAGECGLQDYYMKYGLYNSDMHEPKVTKRKVISIGEHVMLDTERCILCSRCVRFFDEVPKTSEMAIFNRGDRAEIGTYQDQDLDNNYTLNSVDICPVGALTSKDFRFQKRVWFLKEFESICPGCSTGCNMTVCEDPRDKRTFRLQPRYNEDVNTYWMCDYGRMRYKHTNSEHRIQAPLIKMGGEHRATDWHEAFQDLNKVWKTDPKDLAVLVTPQYTSEEIEFIYNFFHKQLKIDNVYHSADPKKAADSTVIDELLLRSDKNPNSRGLLKIAKAYGLEKNGFNTFRSDLKENKWMQLIVFAPEDPDSTPDFLQWFSGFKGETVLIGSQTSHIHAMFDVILPTLSFVEKEGTFVNYQGTAQTIKAGVKLINEAKPVSEILCL